MESDDFEIDVEVVAEVVQGVVDGLSESEEVARALEEWASPSPGWRALEHQPQEIPIALWLALPTGDFVASYEETQEVYAGRVPDRVARALAEARRVETPKWAFLAFPCVFFVVIGGGALMFPDGGGLVSAVLYVVAIGTSWGAVYLVTGPARRLSRDLLDLDLRLQVEEGKVTNKRKDREACWVGIGATMYQVRSRAVFDAIRVGASYRTYRTKGAGRLVALEELGDDDTAGYRDAPRRARQVGEVGGGPESA